MPTPGSRRLHRWICSRRCRDYKATKAYAPGIPIDLDVPHDTRKGNRPSFTDAARPERAEPLYERFCAELRALGIDVATGVFGARMEVDLVNDGPGTIVVGEGS